MLGLFRSKARPHKRYKRACPGTGEEGKWATLYPESRRRNDVCLHCGQNVRVRRQQSERHGWPKGSLILHHSDMPLTWWERFLYWRWS